MENNGMKMVIAGLVAVALIAGAVLVFSGDDDSEDTEANTTQQTTQTTPAQTPQNTQADEQSEAASNIVELAQATDSLSTLVAAVVEAELVETLSGEGPFTVFAPTNDAFAALLAELDVTAEDLLAREDLGDILTYHVVAGEVMAADLSDGMMVSTVQGGMLEVSINGGTVTLTDANGGESTVVSADIEASNGVVHVIDAVVLP